MSLRLINSDSLDINNLLSRIIQLEHIVFGSQGTGNGTSGGTSTLIHANSTYQAQDQNFILADSTTNPFTVYLPSNPIIADIVTVADIGNSTNPITVNGGLHDINGASTSFILPGSIIEGFIYTGSTYGWVTVNNNDIGNWIYANANTNLVKDTNIFADTSMFPIIITFPSTPIYGSFMTITDITGSFSTNHCTIDGNGKTFINGSSSIDLDINYLSITFVYNGFQWVISESTGTAVIKVNNPTYNLVSDKLVLLVDTSTTIVTIILPSTPSELFTCTITDFASSFDVNSCLVQVSNSAHQFNTQPSPLTLDIKYSSVTLIFSNGQWLIKA